MLTYRNFCLTALALIAIPLAIVVGINVVVDPFGFGHTDSLKLDQAALSEYSHDRLFRLARYRDRPGNVIVLGDSRGKSMKPEYFAEQSFPVSNLAFGGGTLFEAIDAFWFAAAHTRLDRVILVLPFNLWSEHDARNRTTEAVGLLSAPQRYYLSSYVTSVALRNVWLNMIGNTKPSNAPPMSPKAFWNHQVTNGAASFYASWSPPRKLRDKFYAMVAHCRQNNIRLNIVIPPTHVDLQRRIDDFKLTAEYAAFLKEMAAVGDLVNFETDTAIVANADNFDDPFHAKPAVMRDVVRRIVEHLRAEANNASVTR